MALSGTPLTETSAFTANIYPPQANSGIASNDVAAGEQALANRTKYLKDRCDATDTILTATKYKARARVKPNGTASPTIRSGSVNVASVAAATSVLTVTFTTPMADTDYLVMTSIGGVATGITYIPTYIVYDQTVNDFKVQQWASGSPGDWSTATDAELSFVVFGSQ